MTLAALNLRVSAQLAADRANNRTSFAAGTSRHSTSEGTGAAPLIRRPGAALHDRPNNGTDRKRIPDFRPFHALEVGND